MSTALVPTVAGRAGRLVRAMELVRQGRVTHLKGTQFLVKSGEDHYVDLMGDPPCYCADAQHRSVDCKHEIAARLLRTDPKVVKAIEDMLAATVQR